MSMSAKPQVQLGDENSRRTRTLWQNAGRHILSDKLTLAAILVLGIMTLLCIVGPPVVENVLGLDVMDRKLLLAIMEKFNGGPVGIDNLAAAIGEARDTIEDVLEPYLIQQGYLQRTPRGRIATAATYRHFGLRTPADGANGELWQEN